MPYDNSQGVAAFWLPRPQDSKKQPLVFVLGTNGPGGLEISTFVSCDNDAVIFLGQPRYDQWRDIHVRELRIKDLDTETAGRYRSSVLANFLADAPVQFAAVTGNVDLAPGENLPFVKVKEGWRNQAETYDRDLRAAGRLYEYENPAFAWLREDSAGPASTAYLQAVYLAAKRNLTEFSPETREIKYMRSVAEGDNSRTFTW
jgi:hypothetical protein